MNPICNALKIAGFAMVPLVGIGLICRKTAPTQSDLVAEAIHFHNGVTQIGKAFSSVFFGSETSEDMQCREKERESKKIIIERLGTMVSCLLSDCLSAGK